MNLGTHGWVASSPQADPYRPFYLRPSAPRRLVAEVYRHLALRLKEAARRDPDLQPQLDALNSAYAAVEGEGAVGPEPPATSCRHPWELLHVDPNAPPDVVELAYHFRQRAQRDAHAERGARERAAGGAPEPAGVEAKEEPANAAPARSAVAPDGRGGEGWLVAARDGVRRVAVANAPVRIGTDPTCDYVVAAGEKQKRRAEARVWRNEDRFVLHSVTPAGVALNGRSPSWAVLEDGDTLQVGAETFRFERRPAGDGQAARP